MPFTIPHGSTKCTGLSLPCVGGLTFHPCSANISHKGPFYSGALKNPASAFHRRCRLLNEAQLKLRREFTLFLYAIWVVLVLGSLKIRAAAGSHLI